MAKISGKVYIRMDGELLESMPEAELELGGDEAEVVAGSNKIVGYREKVVPAMLTCKFVWKAGAPIEKVRNLREGILQFESDVGETYQIANAVCTKTPKISVPDGTIDVEFQGDKAEPV